MMQLSPIGFFHCSAQFKFDVPRQGVLNSSSEKQIGRIELGAGQNFEQALEGLQGFQRIWLIYHMHKNENWKPKVSPQNMAARIGVFATRAPYRPNFLGLSCVKLEEIRGRELFVSEYDLLDATPIFDIKPYLPYSDAFSEQEALHADCWWAAPRAFHVSWNEEALAKAHWIETRTGLGVRRSVEAQLEFQPRDDRRKRLSSLEAGRWRLAYRTWRFDFRMDETACRVKIEDVRSAYALQGFETVGEVPAGVENAVELHMQFVAHFTADFAGSM